ncbi:MAG: DUF4368 domain-containing protein [Clostridia bacterium]|nr:DUF4368 domain-containing protein [Clostridia bacterium]
MVSEKLTEARFQTLADDYKQKQTELTKKINTLSAEIAERDDQATNVKRPIHQVKNYLTLEELALTVVNDIIKTICVHAPDTYDAKRVQEVEICYNCVGILPASLPYDLGKRQSV